MKIALTKVQKLVENVDAEQLIEVVKTAQYHQLDIVDTESDTLDEPELKFDSDNGRYVLLSNNIMIGQADYMKDLLPMTTWKAIFENLNDNSLIETLQSFSIDLDFMLN